MLSIFVALALGTAVETGGADLNAANEWINLIDAHRWEESWSEAGTIFRSKISQAQ